MARNCFLLGYISNSYTELRIQFFTYLLFFISYFVLEKNIKPLNILDNVIKKKGFDSLDYK